MKRIFVLSALTVILLPATGCTSVPGIIKELKDDPAVVQFTITSLYGTVRFARAGANTNSIKVTPEGEVSLNPLK